MTHQDAADKIAQLNQELPMTHEFRTALLHAHQVLSAMGRVKDSELVVSHVVSQSTGKGRLDVTWMGQVCQMSPADARSTAWVFLEAAAVAEAEEDMIRYLKEQVGVAPDQAAAMLHAFRQFRDQAPEASLLTKGEPH
jgi:hypothetical protein